jgi:short-subunit dehydrogenase
MDLHLKNKKVLITGASKGIGAACARSFAAEGSDLVLVARNIEQLRVIKKSITQEFGVNVEVVSADLRNALDLNQLVSIHSEVDILINNAGDIPGGSITAVKDNDWRYSWELKLFGYINLSREIYNAMVERKKGVIINVIGMAAEKPSFDYICGSTANAALVAFTKALGKGPHQKSVRVLGVNPPSTKTERILKVMATIAKELFDDETRINDIPKDKMFQTLIDPEQVADAVVYLSSSRADQLTGVVLNLAS